MNCYKFLSKVHRCLLGTKNIEHISSSPLISRLCFPGLDNASKQVTVCENLPPVRNHSSSAQPLPQTSVSNNSKVPSEQKPEQQTAPSEFRFIYPEFLPDPNLIYRNKVREKLERIDMLKRRSVLNIPEFYVGTIMSVTVSDPDVASKQSTFVGICIDRGGCGLRAWFILRNVVDQTGVEIKYDMYNPLLRSIDVIKLEKRIDPDMNYLRDAPLEYSTIPFDMEPIPHPEGAAVPLNTTKIPLRPPPWLCRWELCYYEGVILPHPLPNKRTERMEKLKKPYEKYDLIKEYRTIIPEEEQQNIFSELIDHHEKARVIRKRQMKKRVIKVPKKTA